MRAASWDFAFCESDGKEKLERLVVVDSVWKRRREKSLESKGGCLKLRWHLSCLGLGTTDSRIFKTLDQRSDAASDTAKGFWSRLYEVNAIEDVVGWDVIMML
jgi:hypothetical protein